MRYRLLEGRYCEGEPGKDKVFNRGDIFDSKFSDLHKRWPEKFERADDRKPTVKGGMAPLPGEDEEDTELREEFGDLQTEARKGMRPPKSGSTTTDAQEEGLAPTPAPTATEPYPVKNPFGETSAPMAPDTVQEGKQQTQGQGQSTPREGQQPRGKVQQPPQKKAQQGQGKSPQGQPKSTAQTKEVEEYHKQLDRMPEDKLREHAEEEEIDLEGCTNRDEVLKRIKEAD